MVRQRSGLAQQRKTGPLVKGKQNITLRKGVGISDDLSFFDNSWWNACGKFRLGARVLQRSSMGQVRIKEAISQAFAVRNYRGKISSIILGGVLVESSDWEQEFYKGTESNAKFVQQRKTRSLVKGKQNITLRKGVGIIDDLSFFDNSWWNACGKFRLGARVLQRSSMGQVRIKEAISQAFAMRNYRGKIQTGSKSFTKEQYGSSENQGSNKSSFCNEELSWKKPLVKGKQNITLRKGVGIIDDLSFFDNSWWNACGKFRLGAKVLQRSSMGQVRIKEAISQAFAMRNYRGKSKF
ncbi:hypothetical protein Q3G72_009563 [Acer saccharum]|nr:hypothetical protein Q3G72_009563 [Acer saccharum]